MAIYTSYYLFYKYIFHYIDMKLFVQVAINVISVVLLLKIIIVYLTEICIYLSISSMVSLG